MKITVFGANGQVGSLVVKELLRRGHTVVAHSYNADNIREQKNLSVIQGDIHDAKSVRLALSDSQAVISALGSWHTPTKDILSSAMKNVIPVMEELGIKRIVSLTGGEARDVGDKPKIINRLAHTLAGLMAGKILHDGEEHIRLLRKSSLDWTVVRSPVMTKSSTLENYKLVGRIASPFETIPRVLVAKCLVDLIESTDHLRSSPTIVRDN